MSEYLDRDKVKEIVTRFTENLEKHFDCLIDDTKLIDKLCQLKPKNQTVIAEGVFQLLSLLFLALFIIIFLKANKYAL